METQKDADLTSYTYGILGMLCQKYDMKPIDFRVKDVRRGKAYYRNRSVTIPTWPYTSYGIKYFQAYVIHEFCHIYFADKGMFKENHGESFKSLEFDILAIFKLVPMDYKRAYYERLFCLEENKVVYDCGKAR